MHVLSDDWTKLALLLDDRNIEFHAQYGRHYKTRIPKYGRDMMYIEELAELVAVGMGNEAYRLNLEQGRFYSPIETGLPGINACTVSPQHRLMAFAGEDGCVEIYDPRSRDCVSRLDVAGCANSELYGAADGAETSAIKFRQDGLAMATGLSTGQILLFDVRSAKPVVVKDHQFGEKIHSIHFHEGSRNIITADKKIVKVQLF